ncbi:alpha/beta fold hydrolase [Stenotrophomonas sp. LGBM10]|uniref:alpha/beta fold hydrolase n=1 Tax=Stenotrophomonas sp. LGBM10 TaxID=3390038 RepID=UPI00398B23C3
MPIVNLPQGALHWTEAAPDADATAVVLLHGLGGDAGFWALEQRALSARFRVLALDLRGSGLSAGVDTPLSIERLAGDVVTMLDAAGIDSAHVVGFSMGGLVAQALAVSAPERVRSLVLAATFATTGVQSRRFLEAVAEVYAGGATARQMFNLVLPWLFSARFLADPRAAPYLHYPDDAPDEQPRADWLRLLDAQLRYDGRPHLGAIRAPTLVLCGDEDRLAPPEDARALADGIRGAVLDTLPGGHLINVECADAFPARVQAFLMATEAAAR